MNGETEVVNGEEKPSTDAPHGHETSVNDQKKQHSREVNADLLWLSDHETEDELSSLKT